MKGESRVPAADLLGPQFADSDVLESAARVREPLAKRRKCPRRNLVLAQVAVAELAVKDGAPARTGGRSAGLDRSDGLFVASLGKRAPQPVEQYEIVAAAQAHPNGQFNGGLAARDAPA